MSQTKDNTSQKFARWAEFALFAVGIALFVLWGSARVDSVIRSRVGLKTFDAINSRTSVSADSTHEHVMASSALENFSGPRGGKSLRARPVSLGAHSDVPLAVLRIPKIGLEVPVLEGTDKRTLNHAVGRIAGTARLGEPGNIGIAGHRDGFFRELKNVTVGDAVELRGPTGTVTYKVDRVSIVDPQDVSVLTPGFHPSLTLVTCYPFLFVGGAPQRYVVSASPAPAPERVVGLASIESRQFTRRNDE